MAKKKIFAIPWWDEWYNLGMLDRQKKVSSLPIIKDMNKLVAKKYPGYKNKKFRWALKRSNAAILNSYFEDLSEYMYERYH